MKDLFVREGVVIAVLPVLSFMGALMFELGYAGEFGYSYSFITIDLKVMVVSLAVTIAVLIPIVAMSLGLLRVMVASSKEIRLLGLEFVLPVIAIVGFCISGFSSSLFFIFFVSSFSFAVSKYSFILLKGLRYGFKQSLSKAAVSEGLTDTAVLRAQLGRIAFRKPFVILPVAAVVLILLAFMVRGVGQGFAHWKNDYQSVQLDGVEYAVLSAYDDLIILGGITEEQFNGVLAVYPKNSEKLANLRSAYLPDFLPAICSIGKWECED